MPYKNPHGYAGRQAIAGKPTMRKVPKGGRVSRLPKMLKPKALQAVTTRRLPGKR